MSTELETAIDLKATFEDIKQFVLQGNALQAFEKYYGEEVIMQENENPPTIGKSANRQREQEFFSKIIEFRAGELKNVAFGENVIISEWFYDYTHQDWGIRTYHQVSVQQWQAGKVFLKRFYYGA